MNNVNAKEKEPLLTVVQCMEQFLPQRTKKKVDTATSQQQEHGTSELQLATCGTSLVTTVQLVTDGEPPSPNIVQQQPTIAMEITQPSCADSDTDNITTQPGTAAFQLSAEPSSSRHCTECNTVTEEVELKPTDISERGTHESTEPNFAPPPQYKTWLRACDSLKKGHMYLHLCTFRQTYLDSQWVYV